MCLWIARDWKKKKEEFLKGKKVIKAYKVLYKNESPLQVHTWEKGLNTSDRTSSALSLPEVYGSEINSGFHCYISKEDALTECPLARPWRVIEVEIKPEDIVAVGMFSIFIEAPCLVATKVFWNGEYIKGN
jgi:hypothetical protein